MYCVEAEKAVLSLFSIFATALLFWVLLGVNLFGFLWNNFWLAPLWGLTYLLIGAAYATGRWWLKGWKWRRKYDRASTEDAKKESHPTKVLSY